MICDPKLLHSDKTSCLTLDLSLGPRDVGASVCIACSQGTGYLIAITPNRSCLDLACFTELFWSVCSILGEVRRLWQVSELREGGGCPKESN